MAEPMHSLPLEKRLEAYRRFADEAAHQAAQANDWEVRTNLLAVAARWQSLAAEIEKVARRLAKFKRPQ